MKATTRFLPSGSHEVESVGEDDVYDQGRPDDPLERPMESTVVRNVVTTSDHPAAAMLDSMQNSAHRARAEEQSEWRAAHQHLVDQAGAIAQALRKVLHEQDDFMAPLAKFQPWYAPRSGRRHTLFAHMDSTLELWRGAARLLGQLEKVESDIVRLSRMHPNGRTDEFTSLSRMVKNAAGADRVLVSTCQMARHLIDQLKVISGKAQP